MLREEVRALDADLPLYDVRTVDDHLAMSRWGQRVFGSLARRAQHVVGNNAAIGGNAGFHQHRIADLEITI